MIRKMLSVAYSAIILAAAWTAPVVAEEMPDLVFEDIFVFGDSLELTESGDPEYAGMAWVKLTF